jgi:hypothetical protein
MNAIWTFFSEINALQFSDKLFLMLPPVEIFGWMIHWSFKSRPRSFLAIFEPWKYWVNDSLILNVKHISISVGGCS